MQKQKKMQMQQMRVQEIGLYQLVKAMQMKMIKTNMYASH